MTDLTTRICSLSMGVLSNDDEHMTDASDESRQLERLLNQAANGVGEVSDELIACAEKRLYALSRRMLRRYSRLRRWEQTDDVYQTAALRLHRSLKEVRPETVGEFMALAATQIRRTLIDLVRHHFGPQGQHARHQSDDGAGAFAVQSTSNRSADEPETLEQWLRFHQAVELLPVSERQIFEPVWYGNLTQQQVADLYGISASTVKRRMRSVRLRLGELLEDEALHQ